MANDGEISIDTKVDTKGLDKGLRSVNDKVKKTSKEIEKSTKPVEGLKVAFNETGGAAAGFTQKMNGLASSGGAVAVGITAAVMAAKKYIDTLKEADEAYKVQEKAERALSAAAENNPYLNPESVQRLKEYAGELQKVSNYGDEGTIDIMAQLASTGRTESEIMKIMGAAADYAAAKHIDLKTAAETLNSTYSGMSGIMGRQIADINDLTDEELKNGDAIDLIAQKYKGFAAEAVDSGIQAKNAFGDFMESIGKIASPTFEALDKMAKSFWERMTSMIEKVDEAIQNARETWVIGGDYRWSKDYMKELDKALKQVHPTKTTMFLEDSAESLSDDEIHHLQVYIESQKKITDNQREFLVLLGKEKQHRDNRARAAEEYTKYAEKWKNAKKEEVQAWLDSRDTMSYSIQELKAVNDVMKAIEEQEKRNAAQTQKTAQKTAQVRKKTADDYAKESNKALKDNLYALEVEAKAKGETVTVQDKYNVYLQSYIDLLTKTEGLIKEGYPVEQKRLEQLKEAKKAVDEAADAEARLAAAVKLTQAATAAINGIKQELTPAEELQKQINALEELKSKIHETSEEEIAAAQKDQETQLSKEELIEGLTAAEKSLIDEKIKAVAASEESWWQRYAQHQQELLELKQAVNESEILSEEEKYERLKELDEAYKRSKAEQYAGLMSQVSSYTSQAVDIINQAANLMLETSQNEARAEQAELEEKYRRGEISEEEYQEAITNSKKKAAKEQYKIQMVQWAASILQATANIAEGVTKAIAQGGIAGLISGALVSAAGAVQIASIIANKPTPPNFAGGGFIGGMNGATMGSDNTYIHARTGEMVANAAQQRNLWEAMNGNGGGSGTNIVINNSAANIATAQPKLTRDKIEIMIDARVNNSMRRGRYDQSMSEAQAGMTGDYYGI